MTVLTGLDVLIARDFDALRGRRVGLLTNPSAVTRDLISAYDVFRRAHGIQLAALFSPEHGFAAAAADGAHVASSVDPHTGVPIHSLYGATLRPTPEMLAEIDVLVCDLQDIGTRYYTYAWTISAALTAAGASGIEVMLLDRPNPLGAFVDGGWVDPDYTSLVGAYPIPVQHGMTLGELMRIVNARWNPTPAALTVIACAGYRRGMTWEETGLTFVPPSPAMPHITTARHYPGACLLEGSTLSEGRGTALPFEIGGAPYIDGAALADDLNALQLPGVRFRPHTFTPSASKHAGMLCFGVQAHIIGADYRPLAAWIALIAAVRARHPDSFAWRAPDPIMGRMMFDLLAGGTRLRAQIEAAASVRGLVDALRAEWDAAAAAWRAERRAYLLYGEDNPI
jgi:uncharacterized protein YbbC (DUF1343 family)